MKRQCLLGTMLLSMFAWESYAKGGHQGQHQQTPRTGSSLAQLKEICHGKEGDVQVKPFESTFECSESKTRWIETAERKIRLPNHSGVAFKASVKDGMHNSDWEDVPGHSETQWGRCVDVEKVKETVRFAAVFHSCAELDAVTSEDAYCAAKLAPMWDDCVSEQNPDGSSHCEFVKLGVVKQCSDGAALPPRQQCQQQQQQCHVQQQTCQDTPAACQAQQQQCHAQQQVQCGMDEPFFAGVSEFDLGGDIRGVTVNKGGIHKHHKAVVISTQPIAGGMLSSLGLNEGDVVSRVNSLRTRSEGDFLKRIAKAKADGHARIEYRSATDGKWRTVKVAPF